MLPLQAEVEYRVTGLEGLCLGISASIRLDYELNPFKCRRRNHFHFQTEISAVTGSVYIVGKYG